MLKIAMKLIVLLVPFFMLTSCVKDVDFDQAEDLLVTPTLEISLVRFNEPANRFVDENDIEQTIVRDSVRIEIFNDDFVVDNLRRAEFLFETTNSINRAFDAEIQFLNDDNELQHLIEFGVEASLANQELVNINEEIFENEAIADLTATTKLLLTFTMQDSNDGSSLNENSIGNLKLRSKGAFYIDLISPD
jgi:hypothetical protein